MALLGMILAGVLLAGLQSVVIGRASMRRIRYNRSFSRASCYAGEDLELIEVIENDKRLPVPWLKLEAEFPAVFRFRGRKGAETPKLNLGSVYQTHTSGFALMPRQRVTRKHFVVCENRGIYRLSTVFMTSGDLLGFVMRSNSVHVESPLVVYPRLLQEMKMPSDWRSWQGEFSVRRWILEDPFLIEGSREYAPGDPMNRIHWKSSARTGTLQAYRQGHSADPQVMIVLDIGRVVLGLQEGSGEEEAEHAISVAATGAEGLIRQGIPVGLIHNAHTLSAERIAPAGGAAQRGAIMEALAGIRLKSRQSLEECLLQESRRTESPRDYVVISAAGSAGIGQAVDRLESRGHKVSVIHPGSPPPARGMDERQAEDAERENRAEEVGA
ncbi:DUF58 domain-containing protein [Saccharibacillus alkalitolerans]|uniref:DUF58 domain-containing protein n=1 Tax=Saccharibacillus alkalitolerans TaxID=2705290 RepID=A0ABX0F7E0_9BACL|nr:DUF58 domain-containing protein [Saccharibacillus alkalitolerans]NGZ75909.1 DUF58 domain-containing protein [Saccharibacillus alkalitolerans]